MGYPCNTYNYFIFEKDEIMLASSSNSPVSPIRDFLGSSSGAGIASMLKGIGGASLGGPVGAAMSQLDFSTTEISSAEAYSGGVSLFGAMGDTGKVKFASKIKTEDYILIALAGLLLFYIL
jgi:hypothetical protein